MESSSFPAAPSDLGRVVARRYTLIERCGTGTFAEVFRATCARTDATCAVKLLRRGQATVATIRRRFEREVKMLARIDHPNVVRVFDSGEDDGQPFLTMPFLRGETLRRILTYHWSTPLPWIAGVPLIRDLLRALDALHDVGIVHRDLKPANAMSTPGAARGEQALVLIDLGLSTWAKDPSETPGGNIGSPTYRAPEIWSGDKASVRSDIYAVGAIFHEVLTSRPPFHGDLGVQHRTAPVRSLRETSPSAMIPGPIDDIVRRALAKDPADRFASASAMLEALQLALEQVLYKLPPGYHLVPASFGRWAGSANRDAPAPATPDRSTQPDAPALPETAPEADSPAQAGDVVAPLAADPERPAAASESASRPRARLGRRGLALASTGLAASLALGILVGRATAPRLETTSTAPTRTKAGGPSTEVRMAPAAPATDPRGEPDRQPRVEASELEPARTSATEPRPAQTRTSGRRGARRDAVTPAETSAKLQGLLPMLRTCEGAPKTVIANLEIARGRGVVKALNSHAPARDDPRFPWHACVIEHLERVRFRVSEIDSDVRVRLPLR